jgi:hypothetical protein
MKIRTRKAPGLLLPLLLALLAVTALGLSHSPSATDGVRGAPRAPLHPTLEPPQGPLFAALALVRRLT